MVYEAEGDDPSWTAPTATLSDNDRMARIVAARSAVTVAVPLADPASEVAVTVILVVPLAAAVNVPLTALATLGSREDHTNVASETFRPSELLHDVTSLLVEAQGGRRDALDRLLPAVYDELRRIASGRLRFERVGHTLNATALVHEAYVKLVDQSRVQWQGRSHFFAVASEAMRRILVNHARHRNAQRRGGGAHHLPLDEAEVFSSDAQSLEIEALGEALDRLEGFDHRGASVVTYRFFGGLKNEEIAEVLGVSPVTVRRSWRSARAWLKTQLGNDAPLSAAGGSDG